MPGLLEHHKPCADLRGEYRGMDEAVSSSLQRRGRAWPSIQPGRPQRYICVRARAYLCTIVTTCSVFVDLTFLFTVSVYFSHSPLTDFQPGNPTWPTPSGITQQQAHTKCLETLHGSQIWTHCQGSQDIVDTYLQNCVADTLVCSKGRQHKCFSPFPLQIQK